MTKHLDLGCGARPRNPYQRDQLYGLDIRAFPSTDKSVAEIRALNLALESIPYDAGSFESVSAYDFLEHVPRVALDTVNTQTLFPFVRLMNEVWRVLKKDGLFYAVTPAYPHHLAFADPTHVNVITRKTHKYFTGTEPMAGMYGFVGRFELVRQIRIHPRGNYQPPQPAPKLRLKMLADSVMRRRSHLLWEFKALK